MRQESDGLGLGGEASPQARVGDAHGGFDGIGGTHRQYTGLSVYTLATTRKDWRHGTDPWERDRG